MSSIFDSAVYQMLQNAFWAKPDPMAFMMEKGMYEGDVTLTCKGRHSVSSRAWWTLTWSEYNETFEVSSQEWELCFWRAFQVHKQNERKRKLQNGPVTQGPGHWGDKTSKGWEQGDGI